ncbi:hypothetical protein LINPERPRIM_LOCUS32803 [Linum perenne]
MGLELAWSLNCELVELQINSRGAAALFSETGNPKHQHALEVLAFQELCRRNWVVSVRHIYREGNKAAAFRGHNFPPGVHHFPLLDCNLGYILQYDVMGILTSLQILINK